MHECYKEDIGWESSVRLALLREEDVGMYLEEREGRKRKWDGKMMRRDESEEREQRRVPPKKVLGEFNFYNMYIHKSKDSLSRSLSCTIAAAGQRKFELYYRVKR